VSLQVDELLGAFRGLNPGVDARPMQSSYGPEQEVAQDIDYGRDPLDPPPWRNPGEFAAAPGPGGYPPARQVVRLDPHVVVQGGEVVCSVLCCATGGRNPDGLDADAAQCNIEIQVPDDMSLEEVDEMIFGGPSVGYISDYVAFPNPCPMLDGEFMAGVEGAYAVVINNLPGMPLPDPWDAGVEDGELEQIEGLPQPFFPPGFAPIPAPFATPISGVSALEPADACVPGTSPNLAPTGRATLRSATWKASLSATAAAEQDAHRPSENLAIRVMNIPGSVRAGTGPSLADVFAYLDQGNLGDSVDFVYLYDCTETQREAPGCLLVHARLPGDAVKLRDHLEAWDVLGVVPSEVAFRKGTGLQALQHRYLRKRHQLTGPPSAYDFSSFQGPVPIEFFAQSSKATPLWQLEEAGIYPRGVEPCVASPTYLPAAPPAAPPPPAQQGKRQRARALTATLQSVASPTAQRDASPPRPSKRVRLTTAACVPEAQPVDLPVKSGDAGPVKRPLTPVASPPSPGAPDAGPSKKPRRNPIVWTPQDVPPLPPLRINAHKGLVAGNKPSQNPGTGEGSGSMGNNAPIGNAGAPEGVVPNAEARTAASSAVASLACGPSSGKRKRVTPDMQEMGQDCPMSVPQERGEKPATSDVPGTAGVSPPPSAPQDDAEKRTTADASMADPRAMHQSGQGFEPSSNGFSKAAAVDIAAETSQHHVDAVPAAEETQSAVIGVIRPPTDAKTVAGHLLPCVEDRRAVPTSAAPPPVAEGPCSPPATNGVLGSLRVALDSRLALPVTRGTAAADQGPSTVLLSCDVLPGSMLASEVAPHSLPVAIGSAVDRVPVSPEKGRQMQDVTAAGVKQVEDVTEARAEHVHDVAAADQVGHVSAAGVGQDQVEDVTATRAEQVEGVSAARSSRVEVVAAARADQVEDVTSAERAEPLPTFKDMDMSKGELPTPPGASAGARSRPGTPSTLKGSDAGNSIPLDVNGVHAGYGSPRDGPNGGVGGAGNCTRHAEVLGREKGCDAERLESEFDGDFIPLE
jgi:hypothetical protein